MGMQNMQRELMEKGSMTVAFTVYEDFELYKTGVYQHVKGKNKIKENYRYLLFHSILCYFECPDFVYCTVTHLRSHAYT